MSKQLQWIEFDAEDVIKAVEKFDYDLGGKLRAMVSSARLDSIKVLPQSPVSVSYTEVNQL